MKTSVVQTGSQANQVRFGVITKFNRETRRGTVRVQPTGEKLRFSDDDCHPRLLSGESLIDQKVIVEVADCGAVMRLYRDVTNC